MDCTECYAPTDDESGLCSYCKPATSSPVTVDSAIAAIDAAIESTSDSQTVATVDGDEMATLKVDSLVATEEPLTWLEPTDGHAVTQEAKSAVVESVARILPVATVTLRITAPPEQGPTPPPPPGVLPPLEMEPCDCKPGCRETRVVGYRLCHPCGSTFKAENYEFHVSTHNMSVTELNAAWASRYGIVVRDWAKRLEGAAR